MPCGDFKDLRRRTVADKVLRNKALSIAKNSKYNGYHCGIAPMVYNFFNEKTSAGTVKIQIMSNQDLAGELHNVNY